MSGDTQTALDAGPGDGVSPAVHVSHRVEAPVATVWQHLVSPRGTAALLGDGAALGSKGESWRSNDGPHGVVRSYHPLEQVRVSWHADDDAPATLVDIRLVPDAGATRVELVHEPLVAEGTPLGPTRGWQDALERFSTGLSDGPAPLR